MPQPSPLFWARISLPPPPITDNDLKWGGPTSRLTFLGPYSLRQFLLPTSPDHLPLRKTVSPKSLEMVGGEEEKGMKGQARAMHQRLRVRGKLSEYTNPISHSLPQISPALKTWHSTNKKPSRGGNQIQTSSSSTRLCPWSPQGSARALSQLRASCTHTVKARFQIYRSLVGLPVLHNKCFFRAFTLDPACIV